MNDNIYNIDCTTCRQGTSSLLYNGMRSAPLILDDWLNVSQDSVFRRATGVCPGCAPRFAEIEEHA